jgi:hypothetical protein
MKRLSVLSEVQWRLNSFSVYAEGINFQKLPVLKLIDFGDHL